MKNPRRSTVAIPDDVQGVRRASIVLYHLSDALQDGDVASKRAREDIVARKAREQRDNDIIAQGRAAAAAVRAR